MNTVVNLIDDNTLEYIYGMLSEDPCNDDTKEFVHGILMEVLLSQDDVVVDGVGVCDSFCVILDSDKQQQQQQQQQCNTPTDSPQITSPPMKTKIRPNTKNTHTHTQTKDRHKKKKAIPLKIRTPPKTTHEIKRPIVNVGEVEQYLQHVQNNPDLDEFLMNNPTIRTQIAKCEVAYYKIRHTNPVLTEVNMEFYHSLLSVQVLLGEITRLESLAIRLKANNTKTNTTTTTATLKSTTDRLQPNLYTNKDTTSKIE